MKKKTEMDITKKSKDDMKKPSSAIKDFSIEEIFEKKKKPEKEKKLAISASVISSHKDEYGDSRGLRSGVKRYTEEGFPIFTVQEMNVKVGKETVSCPFDCDCCY